MKSKLLLRLARRLGFVPARRNAFIGAIQSRLTSDWIASSASPTMELSGSLRTLRDRARELERNNPLVRRYLNLVAENVVGHKGLQLQARNTLPDGRPNRQANAAIEMAWCEWHRKETCTVEGQLSWVDFTRQIMRAVPRDGEAFVRVIEAAGGYGFTLQQIDPELVDEDYNVAADRQSGNAVRLGVEVDRWGRPVAYHVFKGHLYDITSASRERERISADEMIHLFIPRRPGQTRGETWLAPVMLPLRFLDGYTEAELVAARTAAAKMGFITPGEDAEGPEPDAPAQQEIDAAPGVIDRLGKGEQFQAWDPTHPSGNFAAFVTQIEKILAVGLNVSYASLSGDLREVNYSSIRAGLLQERDGWRALQCWLAEHLCEPVYRRWREVAWMRGHLALRMPPSEYRDHHWQARGWAWVDPDKDITAAAKAVAFGFTSPQRVVGEDGNDYEEILTEIAAANELAESLDVPRMLPQGVTDAEGTGGDAAGADGPAGAGAGGGSGGAGDEGGGGRAHPRVALLRSAGGAVVR